MAGPIELTDPTVARTWVRRRVENLTFIDDRSFAREVVYTIDLCEYAAELCHGAPNDTEVTPSLELVQIPLLRLSRSQYTTVVVRNASGAIMPHVDFATERRLVADYLLEKWLGNDRSVLDQFRPSLLTFLTARPDGEVSDRRKSAASFLVRVLGVEMEDASRLRKLGEDLEAAGCQLEEDVKVELLSECWEWQRSRQLLVTVPVEALHEPVVILAQYLEALPERRKTIGPRWALQQFRRLLAGSVSWGTTIPMPGSQMAASFHINAYAPEGFKVLGGMLRLTPTDAKAPKSSQRRLAGAVALLVLVVIATRWFPLPSIAEWLAKHPSNQKADAARWAMRLGLLGATAIVIATLLRPLHPPSRNVYDDDRLPSAAHVRLHAEDVDNIDKLVATFGLSLYAHRTGFFFESLLSALTGAAVVSVFTWWLEDKNFLIANAYDGNFAAALVLLVPTIATTVITQRDSTRIASRTFALPRFVMFLQLVGVLGCSLVFAFELAGQTARHVWYPFAGVVWICALRQVLGATTHLWRISDLRDRLIRYRRRLVTTTPSWFDLQ